MIITQTKKPFQIELDLRTGSDKKKGLIQLFRSLEPAFGLDNKPSTPDVERRVKIIVTKVHKDFEKLAACLGPILGDHLVRKVHLISAEYTSGPQEVHTYVEMEVQ